jgi:hypothetical protein
VERHSGRVALTGPCVVHEAAAAAAGRDGAAIKASRRASDLQLDGKPCGLREIDQRIEAELVDAAAHQVV